MFFVLHFDVGESGVVVGAEIDEFFASVDEAVLEEFFEGVIDGVDYWLVEGEHEMLPVAGSAEGAELELHATAFFGDKIPDAVVELFAGEIEAGLAFFGKEMLVDDPCLEAGMVCAGDVDSVLTA